MTIAKLTQFVAMISCLLLLLSVSCAADVYYPPVAESLDLLTSTNQHIRDRGMRALVGMGKAASPAYDVLITIALSSNSLPRTRSSAAKALQNVDAPKATMHFVQELTNSSATTREYAVDALMTIRRPEATVPLFHRLKDENEQVRGRAGIALQFYKNKELEKLLLESLSNPTDKAREWAPWLLGRMHSEAALAQLHALLADNSPDFRKSVVAALRDIQSKISVSPLIEVVTHDEDDEIRMRAIQCLGELGDQKAAATVVAALDDENPEVRAYAAGAIGALGVDDARPRLREILKQGIGRETLAAMGALCQMKDTDSIPIIVGHLNSENEIITQYMMQGLIELGAESEIMRLKTQGNPRVRSLAELALQKLQKRKNHPTKSFREDIEISD